MTSDFPPRPTVPERYWRSRLDTLTRATTALLALAVLLLAAVIVGIVLIKIGIDDTNQWLEEVNQNIREIATP